MELCELASEVFGSLQAAQVVKKAGTHDPRAAVNRMAARVRSGGLGAATEVTHAPADWTMIMEGRGKSAMPNKHELRYLVHSRLRVGPIQWYRAESCT